MHPEFPHDDSLLYLNHAGVGPWPRRTADAVAAFAEENAVRGAADYPDWLAVERRLRERLARLLGGVDTSDVSLVKNTSEGLSLVAYGLDWRGGDNVVINDQEFPSNRMVWESLAQRFGVEVRDVSLASTDSPEDALLNAMDERTRVLPVSSVQYASGLRMDLSRLGAACRANGTLFCVDAIQSLGALAFDAPGCGADFVVADGHKWMLGPEGIGVLYATPRARDALNLLQYGWHMAAAMGDYDRTDWEPARDARRFEAGSPNSLGIHALDASLSLLEETGPETVESHVISNARYLMDRVAAEPGLELLTPSAQARHAGIVTFRVAGAEPGRLFRELRGEGVICAARGGGIRFSPHFYNDRQQLDRAVETLLSLRSRAGTD
ncbi:MAG: aminotransferase class V-fold PLP-dependent enzyme [Ectothiorhodospiraceae bacterium]|jgi:selenocysteine lyase/cysteine desulfurase